MALDPRVRYLCKTQDNGKRVIYQWTPTLAVKKGMRPVSVEEAQRISDEEAGVRIEKRNAALGIIDIPEDSAVVEAVTETKLSRADEDKINQVKKLVVTNEDILQKELAHVEAMESPADVEQYFLIKYHLELEASEDIDKIKKEAAYTLSQLANQNKLYEKDN